VAFALGGLLLPGPTSAAAGERHEQWLELRANTVKDRDLVLYFDFQERDGDTVRNHGAAGPALDGRVHGARRTTGRWNGKRGLLFNGRNSYLEVPDHPSFVFFGEAASATKQLTIEAWVRPDSAQEAGLVDKWSEGWGKHAPFGLWITAKHFLGLCGDGSNGNGAKDPVEVTIQRWVHLVVVYDTTSVRLFKDGVMVSPQTRTVEPLSNEKPVIIGCMKPGLYHFKGVIDELAIYRRALSAEEVRRRFRSKTVFTFTIP